MDQKFSVVSDQETHDSVIDELKELPLHYKLTVHSDPDDLKISTEDEPMSVSAFPHQNNSKNLQKEDEEYVKKNLITEPGECMLINPGYNGTLAKRLYNPNSIQERNGNDSTFSINCRTVQKIDLCQKNTMSESAMNGNSSIEPQLNCDKVTTTEELDLEQKELVSTSEASFQISERDEVKKACSTGSDANIEGNGMSGRQSSLVDEDSLQQTQKTEESHSRIRTPFNNFLDSLKDPSCSHVVAAFQRFVRLFPAEACVDRAYAASLIHPFLNRMYIELLKCKVFRNISATERLLVEEGIEKFIFRKLYNRLFAVSTNDCYEDELLHKKIRCLGWVKLCHLELPEFDNIEDPINSAKDQLSKLDKVQSPGDKLILILNVCRIVVGILHTAIISARKIETRPACADDILPLLIYIVIQANPPSLHSNIEFCSYLRNPNKLVSEDAYFFTHFVSAVAFIKNLGHSTKLSIETHEYERLYKVYENNFEEELRSSSRELALTAMDITSKITCIGSSLASEKSTAESPG